MKIKQSIYSSHRTAVNVPLISSLNALEYPSIMLRSEGTKSMHKVKLSLVYTFCEDVWKIFSIEMLKATAGVSCLQINATTPHKKATE